VGILLATSEQLAGAGDLEVVPTLYEAQRLVFLRLQSHVNKESRSAAEQEEVSKKVTSLIGRIGKLYLTASPKIVNAVNDFCQVLSDIYDGHYPNPSQPHIFRKMKAAERVQIPYGTSFNLSHIQQFHH
jgi:hypothetical protein